MTDHITDNDLLKEIQAKLYTLPDLKAGLLKRVFDEPFLSEKYKETTKSIPDIIPDTNVIAALDNLQEPSLDLSKSQSDFYIYWEYAKFVLSCSENVCDKMVDWIQTETASDLLNDVKHTQDKLLRAQRRLDARILPVLDGAGPYTHVVDVVENATDKTATVYLRNYKEDTVEIPLAILNSAYPELTQEFLPNKKKSKTVKPQ